MVLTSERAASQDKMNLGNQPMVLLCLHQTGATQTSWQPQAKLNSPDSLGSTAHAHTQHLASEYRW